MCLPYPGFSESAKALDTTRLELQAATALNLLRNLTKAEVPTWHLGVGMWIRAETSLALYGMALCRELHNRDSRDPRFRCHIRQFLPADGVFVFPGWLGLRDVHRGHQATLLRGNPKYYSERFDVDPNTPCLWPASVLYSPRVLSNCSG